MLECLLVRIFVCHSTRLRLDDPAHEGGDLLQLRRLLVAPASSGMPAPELGGGPDAGKRCRVGGHRAQSHRCHLRLLQHRRHRRG